MRQSSPSKAYRESKLLWDKKGRLLIGEEKEERIITCRDRVVIRDLLGCGLSPELLNLFGKGVSDGMGTSPGVNSGL